MSVYMMLANHVHHGLNPFSHFWAAVAKGPRCGSTAEVFVHKDPGGLRRIQMLSCS